MVFIYHDFFIHKEKTFVKYHIYSHRFGRVDASMVALRSSRGYESATSKLLMRASVLVSDIITYLPAGNYYIFPIPCE